MGRLRIRLGDETNEQHHLDGKRSQSGLSLGVLAFDTAPCLLAAVSKPGSCTAPDRE